MNSRANPSSSTPWRAAWLRRRTVRSFVPLLLGASLAFVRAAPAAPPPVAVAAPEPGLAPTSSRRVVLRVGKLLDPRSGKVLEHQAIVIEDGKVKSISPQAGVAAAPPGALDIDLERAFALPGLIDAHTHLTSDPYNKGYPGLGVSVPRATLVGAATRDSRWTPASRAFATSPPLATAMSPCATRSTPATSPARA